MSRTCATTLPCFGEQEGRHLVLGVHPMLMVDTDAVAVERLLHAGGLTCPSCGGVLAPWATLVGGLRAGSKALCGIGQSRCQVTTRERRGLVSSRRSMTDRQDPRANVALDASDRLI
jgi:hypothetical protein